MSTAETGEARVVADVVADAKALLSSERAEELRQLDMLDPLTPEEMAEARQGLGPRAGNLSVLAEARARRRGRPAGARNKRTDDFARYLLGFGQHPAITMMQIQATAPEVLIENSRRVVEKVLKGGKDKPDVVVEVEELTLTYEAAQSLRIRCAEGLMPYLESKKPVAVDMTFNGVADLIIEGVTHSREEVADIVDADFMAVPDDDAEQAA